MELAHAARNSSSRVVGVGHRIENACPALAPVGDWARLVRRMSGSRTVARMIVMAAQRILVVDDNHDSADSLALLLSLHGHIVEARFTGQGLVDYALAFKPDLVLLDIGLPGLSGYDVAAKIRAEPRLAKVCVAAVSGFSGHEFRNAQFDAQFVKPVDLHALVGLINSLPRK